RLLQPAGVRLSRGGGRARRALRCRSPFRAATTGDGHDPSFALQVWMLGGFVQAKDSNAIVGKRGVQLPHQGIVACNDMVCRVGKSADLTIAFQHFAYMEDARKRVVPLVVAVIMHGV